MRTLLKYEFKDTAPLLSVFTLGVLALTLILLGIYRLEITFISQLVLGIAWVAPVLYFLVVFFYLVYFRYYRNLYSGQGYLTHSLPLRGSTIYVAKLLYIVLTLLVALIVVGLCFAIKEIIGDGIDALVDTFHTMMDFASNNGWIVAVFITAFLINSVLVGPILAMFAITVGCGKHLVQLGKIPGIILALILTYIGTQLISFLSLAIPLGIAPDGGLTAGTHVYEQFFNTMSANTNASLATMPIGWLPATVILAIVLALITSNQMRYHTTLR